MLYELRVYDARAGKLPALNDRFANHTTGFFKDHGIGIVGFLTDEIGRSNQPWQESWPDVNLAIQVLFNCGGKEVG